MDDFETLLAANCLAVEDSPAGIESAFRAGCMPILVPDLDGSDDAMRTKLFAEADCLSDLIDLILSQTILA